MRARDRCRKGQEVSGGLQEATGYQAVVAYLIRPISWAHHSAVPAVLGGTIGALLAVILRLHYGFT